MDVPQPDVKHQDHQGMELDEMNTIEQSNSAQGHFEKQENRSGKGE